MKIPLIVKAFAVAIPLGVTFVDFVGYVARVDGISMRPSLNPIPGQVDFVFLNKWAVRNYDISRGEIIALISPKNPDQRFIKRVVGLEGDIIPSTNYKKGIVTVPSGHCWVEGDHIGSSFDSNNFGPVSLGLVTAKATHIVWPPSRYCTKVEIIEQFMTGFGGRFSDFSGGGLIPSSFMSDEECHLLYIQKKPVNL